MVVMATKISFTFSRIEAAGYGLRFSWATFSSLAISSVMPFLPELLRITESMEMTAAWTRSALSRGSRSRCSLRMVLERYQFSVNIRLCFEDLDEGFLRNLDCAEGFHALFAFLLFFEKFAFAADVAAVAFGGDV